MTDARCALISLLLTAACAPPASLAVDSPHMPGSFPDSIVSGSATLHGTLLVPANRGAPVALIIAGSGPTNRDGNTPLLAGKNNSLRYLAEALAQRGIASLRYDKRGIGQSSGAMAGLTEADLRFDHFVDDATAWGRKLAADRRFSSVVVIGHSEGSLIGMLAAPAIPASKVVSIAGLGAPAGEVIIRQLTAQLPAPLLAQATAAVHRIERGELLDSVPPGLNALFRPSVQPYLISWFKHDPAVVAGRLGVPLLVMHGTHDIQILEEDARAIAAGNPRATLKLIPGMNHVLKQSPPGREEQMPAYSDSTLAIDPALVDAIAGFVRPRN
ncbi:MAG TPA: alpha/beta fold hydrolase [Gemmatimonadales bacterium]|nr:alpha/beta fold hydrolase [Gemmatimonadales bacterium]